MGTPKIDLLTSCLRLVSRGPEFAQVVSTTHRVLRCRYVFGIYAVRFTTVDMREARPAGCRTGPPGE
jgi:hypothetical protein